MLNISPHSIDKQVDRSKYGSFRKVVLPEISRRVSRWLLGIFAFSIIVLFLPWTQNIRSRGQVTSLDPSKLPQTVQSRIDGMVEEWYVNEGDMVERGDTLARLSDIKDDYFDPNLLNRTEEQITALEQGNESYKEKAEAISAQLEALQAARSAKLQQARNKLEQSRLKVISDSTDWQASRVNAEIADLQYKRQYELYEKGLKSLTDLENRNNKLQEALAKEISARNKLETSRAELNIARTELLAIGNDYDEKIAKANSDRFSALSAYYDGEGKLTKMKNQLVNYEVRRDNYFITAPQSGMVTEARRSGIGETVKQGEALCTVVPMDFERAVEIFVEPMDMPLIHPGNRVQIQFDGWPAIIFSGWPNITYGTFPGEVVAVDKAISSNGKFKVMVKPMKSDEFNWPDPIRIGTGVSSIALLNDVPIWYEIWRQLNGFPPDFYTPEKSEQEGKEKK